MSSASETNFNCRHITSTKLTTASVFIEHFLSGNKLIDKKTNTAQCVCCGERIAVPPLFSHFGLKILYFLLAACLAWGHLYLVFFLKSSLLLYLGPFLIGIVMFATVRLSNAFIFTFCQWSTENEDSILLLSRRNRPSYHRKRKFASIVLGIVLAQYAFLVTLLL